MTEAELQMSGDRDCSTKSGGDAAAKGQLD